MSLPLAQWDHSLFEDLQHLLARVTSRPTTSAIRRLHLKLEEARPWLLALTSLPGPNEQDKQDVEKNPINLPSGVSVKMTGEALTTTNYLSDMLQYSQLLSAVLALQAEEQRPRFPSRSIPEIAVFILYDWTSKLLDFLHELLRLTIVPNAEVGQPFDGLRTFVEELLLAKSDVGRGKEKTFVDHIMSQLDERHARIVALVNQRGTGNDFELLSFRVGALRAQQNKLAGILAEVAQSGYLGRGDVAVVLKWLKRREQTEPLVTSVLSSLFAAIRPLDSLDHDDVRLETIEGWCRDARFLRLASHIVYQDDWANQKLRDIVKLAWSLSLASALRVDHALSPNVGIDPSIAEQYLSEAVNGDVFQFLRELVWQIRREQGLETGDEEKEMGEDALQRIARRFEPENNLFVYRQLQDLVGTLAARKHFLRNLRNKEEDVAIRRSQLAPPPAHFQTFMLLVAAIYQSLPPDSAEHLWDDTTFLSAVLDARASGYPAPPFFEMMVAISTGPSCATKAFEKLKDTRISWGSLFKFYQHYESQMVHLHEPVRVNRSILTEPMGPEDAALGKGWSELLANVVRWSPLARSSLLQYKPFPPQLLVDFLNCEVYLELKAAVLDALSAFCRRTGDVADDDALNRTVELYEKISFREPTLDIRQIDVTKVQASIGWLDRMETGESELRRYPLLRSYISFLGSLLPDPASTSETPAPSRPRLNSALRRGIKYIIERVLFSLSERPFTSEKERWSLIDAILALMEKAVLSFNMSELFSQSSSRSIGNIAISLHDEPGFAVIQAILSEPKIFGVLADVLDKVAGEPQPRPKVDTTSLLRVLRIYHRIFEVQLVYCDVLLLTLCDPARVPNHHFRRPHDLQTLDNLILHHRLSNVNSIALLVGDDDLVVSYTATKIISAISISPAFSRSDIFRGEYHSSINRLAGLIDASDDSLRIAQGFTARLAGNGDDFVSDEMTDVQSRVLRGDVTRQNLDALPLVIRSTILDLLVEGTAPDATEPNLAHFLLGFEIKGNRFTLQDPLSADSRLSCLQVVLDQLEEGTNVHGSGSTALLLLHPILAAKTARLIHQLFSHPLSARSTMEYTAAHTNLSALQLASLPRQCPPVLRDDVAGLGLVKNYQSQTVTTADTLVAFLDFQRYTLSAVALETFAQNGQGASADQVARFLFRGSSEDEEFDGDELVGSSRALLIDLVSNIDLTWTEIGAEGEQQRTLDFLAAFDFDKFKRVDVDWYDLDALARDAKANRRIELQRRAASGAAAGEAYDAELAYVLSKLGSKNRETEISIAKGAFLTAWNEALKVALATLFRLVPEEQQEVQLFDLLDALLDRAGLDLAPGVLEIICEAILVTMTTLVDMLSEYGGVNLPVERLGDVLYKTLDAVIRPGTTENARGNLYAAISQFIGLVSISTNVVVDDVSVIASTIGRESIVQTTATTLQKSTLAVIGQRKDRFFAVLCRDALDDRDVWKTECFALLGAIVGICSSERDRQLLSPLAANGFLPVFVRSIKDREIALQECLALEPENLHAYWVYEAKVAFLMTIAASRRGAEDLLDAGLFEMFAMCGFISVQPIVDDSMDEQVASESTARQHRVLICALQLLVRTLSSLHKSTRSGAGHALSFLNAHRESILLLLRENLQIVTSTSIEECRLIISMLAMVSHKVPSDDFRSSNGFGAFHLSVLAAAAGFFERAAWTENVLEESEIISLEKHVLNLNQVILAYLCATTSGLKSGSGFPVFVSGSRVHHGPTRLIATAPSLHLAVSFIAELLEAVQDLSEEFETLFRTLRDGGQVNEEALQRLNNADLVAELDAPFAADDLTSAFAARTALIYNMIESLLLLAWRHLLYYANDTRGPTAAVRPDNISLSLTSFSASQLDASTRASGQRNLEKVAAALKGVLERLDEVDVSSELRQRGGDSHHGMLVRRLRELSSGLIGESAETK
ncbi:nucleoporin Nup186/Nup192/Nup205 [Naematelia encephala]|uniref:Nucleoporin Nup186/Nup192/Nup205 n=1 Tax=Naematelia encephala TaxID=71784 RepID=A0A1Y2AKE0_9TREE|nr:nucleoporin Nup186/Nup192/Nup205 [Naematelia encephala]